jgi:hypothetical protein
MLNIKLDPQQIELELVKQLFEPQVAIYLMISLMDDLPGN